MKSLLKNILQIKKINPDLNEILRLITAAEQTNEWSTIWLFIIGFLIITIAIISHIDSDMI